jgi:hypothetical protein
MSFMEVSNRCLPIPLGVPSDRGRRRSFERLCADERRRRRRWYRQERGEILSRLESQACTIMPHKPFRASIFRSVRASLPVLAAMAATVAGCESAPKASEPDPAVLPRAQGGDSAGASTAPKERSGPKRIQASRPAPAAPAPTPDPSGVQDLDIDPPRARASSVARESRTPPAASSSAVATPPAASAGSTTGASAAAPSGRAPSAAERAAAARMAAESDARRKAAADARNAAIAQSQAADDTAVWSVFLASFTGEDHREAAQASRDAIIRRYPALADAFVGTNSRGSMVLVGRFSGPEDAAAQARLKAVKEIQEGGQRSFGRAMLTRTATDSDQGPPGPFDLRTVRARQPKGTLYSVQVAVWSSFGAKEVPYSEMKRAAEAYCRDLRSKGEQAYYFHDSYSRTSTVMVGVFGTDAYDSRSTLYAPEVDAVFRRFPKHLVNGDELLQPADAANPDGKKVPQAPRLVEIPRM